MYAAGQSVGERAPERAPTFGQSRSRVFGLPNFISICPNLHFIIRPPSPCCSVQETCILHEKTKQEKGISKPGPTPKRQWTASARASPRLRLLLTDHSDSLLLAPVPLWRVVRVVETLGRVSIERHGRRDRRSLADGRQVGGGRRRGRGERLMAKQTMKETSAPSVS